VEDFNTKAKLTTRKAYGFRTYHGAEIALYHALGETLNASTVLVNPITLSKPINIVAAEIGHELVHVNDFLRGRIDAY
jgi:hypothetical protein